MSGTSATPTVTVIGDGYSHSPTCNSAAPARELDGRPEPGEGVAVVAPLPSEVVSDRDWDLVYLLLATRLRREELVTLDQLTPNCLRPAGSAEGESDRGTSKAEPGATCSCPPTRAPRWPDYLEFALGAETGNDGYELQRRLGHQSQRYINRYTNPPEDIAAGYREPIVPDGRDHFSRSTFDPWSRLR